MRIAFFPQNLLPVHAASLDERPLGGTETGLIRLAKSLHELGHKVVVFTSDKSPPKSEPPYYHLSAANGLKEVDVFVAIREWIPLASQIPTTLKFLWTGDSYDQPFTFGIGDKRVSKLIDGVLTVSAWQAKTLSMASGFPEQKCCILRNGIHPDYFQGQEERKPKRLIYSSTPFRGLELLPNIFKQIRLRHPDSTLEVFSGFKVYEGDSPYAPDLQQKYKAVFDELKGIPGVTLHGNVKQEQLAREFMKSSILAYPNIFEETSCITALEAMAAGCIPITSALGALPETVGDFGACIGGDPRSAEFQKKFIDEVCLFFDKPDKAAELSAAAREHTLKNCSWDSIAKRLAAFLEQVLKTKREKLLAAQKASKA